MTRKIIYGISAILTAAALAFAYYAISPLFVTITADEALPELSQSVSKSAQVIGTTGHPASGKVGVVESEGKSYVRYENFKTINGPDIFVYLSKDIDAKEFIDLGPVRATEGNVNYEIPAGVNPADYRYVLTWCKQFGVLFNYAEIPRS